jgi:arsenite methyltransferase
MRSKKVIMKVYSAFVFLALAASPSADAFVPLTRNARSITTTTTQLFVATNPVKKLDDKPALFVDETRASVSKYYGQELTKSEDLKTNACCTAGAPPTYIQEAINNIHPEVVARYYGCGLCLPQYPLEGAKILDLGSGSGRDVYIASQLVGPTGKVRLHAVAYENVPLWVAANFRVPPCSL